MMTADKPRTPYNAKHVAIVDEGHTITALYIPDPDEARRPAYVLDNILDRSRYDEVEVIAIARKHVKAQGDYLSGWVVATGAGHGGDYGLYPNKRAARRALREDIRAYFNR